MFPSLRGSGLQAVALFVLAVVVVGFPDTPCVEIGAAQCRQAANDSTAWSSLCGLTTINVKENHANWADLLPRDFICELAMFDVLSRQYDIAGRFRAQTWLLRFSMATSMKNLQEFTMSLGVMMVSHRTTAHQSGLTHVGSSQELTSSSGMSTA